VAKIVEVNRVPVEKCAEDVMKADGKTKQKKLRIQLLLEKKQENKTP
jgi:hypothetical protein